MMLTKDGRYFIIRQPTKGDAEAIIRYSKLVFASTDQVLTTPDEYNITIEYEEQWIQNLNDNPNARILMAEMSMPEGTSPAIIGLLFFIPGAKRKNAHTGEFGVNVHPDFQRVGVGRALVENLLAWAKNNDRIEKVFLSVFHTNVNAIKLYRSLGFKEEGTHVRAARQLSGLYVDIIQMYREC